MLKSKDKEYYRNGKSLRKRIKQSIRRKSSREQQQPPQQQAQRQHDGVTSVVGASDGGTSGAGGATSGGAASAALPPDSEALQQELALARKPTVKLNRKLRNVLAASDTETDAEN